jgi:glucose-6-phosphate isomerase
MLTKNIKFKNFGLKIKNLNLKKDLQILLSKKNEIFKSLSLSYDYSYSNKLVNKFKKNSGFIRVIGMGGSILGTEAIYDFLKHKIKKKFSFINSLKQSQISKNINQKNTNIIVSKSGNTLETISNVNIMVRKSDKNIFITENNNSYLRTLAHKLKAEIIDHNNYIGGRYSVLSEVGMLPAELMGLNEKKFKQLNALVKKKKFINALTNNVSAIFKLIKKNKFTSIILNYDERSENLFKWYQQLIAESLGKKSKGILPVVSSMPKDNHSLMQLYLDGPKKSFYTFFYVFEKNTTKIKNNQVLSSYNYLKNKSISKILYSQKLATEKIFKTRKIPFRSFEIFQRDEKTIGELFCFFILETILLGRALGVNPYDQPSVELIKKETKKILISN